MSSNSNFNITKVVVDKITQEITNLEVNGKPIDLSQDFDPTKLSFETSASIYIEPSSDKLGETIITIDADYAPEDIHQYIIVKYDNVEIGYIDNTISFDSE